MNISEKYLISAKKHKKSDALHQAFYINEGGVAGYGSRMKAKYTVNWDVQIAGMVFQTLSSLIQYNRHPRRKPIPYICNFSRSGLNVRLCAHI